MTTTRIYIDEAAKTAEVVIINHMGTTQTRTDKTWNLVSKYVTVTEAIEKLVNVIYPKAKVFYN